MPKEPIFDFQNPNPSLNNELKIIQDKAEKYYIECIDSKLKTLRSQESNTQRLGWAYKALMNSICNFLIIGETLIKEKFGEQPAAALNLSFGIIASQYVGFILIELAKIENKKKADAEIDLLERMHGLEG